MAMTQPSFIPAPWAADGTYAAIPEQTTAAGRASWTAGFPPECAMPLAAGGIPPHWLDFQGVLHALSEHAIFQQSGGCYEWSADIDYPAGSIVFGSDGLVWQALQDSGPGFAVGAKDPAANGNPSFWFANAVSPANFGAVGDGATNDTAAFVNLESVYAGRRIDLLGRSYVVSSIPAQNYYYNGSWVVGGVQKPAYDCDIRTLNYRRGGTWIGQEPVLDINDWNVCRDFFIATPDGCRNTSKLVGVVGIGNSIMAEGEVGDYTIAIGDSALHSLNGGDRNLAIGTLALFGTTTGSQNTALGRDAGQCITSGSSNVALGYGAMAGWCPITLKGKIEKAFNMTGSDSLCIGSSSGQFLSSGTRNILLGVQAGEDLKISQYNTIVGVQAMAKMQENVSVNGKDYVALSTPASSVPYSCSGTSITVTLSGHSAVAGGYVQIAFNTGDLASVTTDIQYLTVISAASGSFVLLSPAAFSASGTCTVYGYEQSASATNTGSNTVVGCFAGVSALSSANCDLIGYSVASGASTMDSSDVMGAFAGNAPKSLNRCVFIGTQAGNAISGAGSEAIRCTAVGADAMRHMQDGSPITSLTNSTAIGYNAAVSGGSQLQLGTTGVTTYVYGSVQDRSDERDKTDIRDTILGLDFIKALRPVDFRWDYRDDYIEVVEDGVDENGAPVSHVEKHEKDGSKKRVRFHHGLIAQEVKAVLDAQDIDFGGYQDHKVNGGCDVLTLGYEEFIAPMIKAIQELDSRLGRLEG